MTRHPCRPLFSGKRIDIIQNLLVFFIRMRLFVMLIGLDEVENTAEIFLPHYFQCSKGPKSHNKFYLEHAEVQLVDFFFQRFLGVIDGGLFGQ